MAPARVHGHSGARGGVRADGGGAAGPVTLGARRAKLVPPPRAVQHDQANCDWRCTRCVECRGFRRTLFPRR
eukprot:242853-Lingulodinium_polyedra.AAC.1